MKQILLAFAGLSLAGCTSLTSLENVAGTWTCPRVDGVCADIATIDAGLMGALPAARGLGDAMATEAGLIAVQGGAALTRAPDEIARIVFAPAIDSAGHYHAAKAVYAVMASGGWTHSPMPETASRQVAANVVEKTGEAAGEAAATAGTAVKLAEAMVAAETASTGMRAPGMTVTYRRPVLAEAHLGEPAQ